MANEFFERLLIEHRLFCAEGDVAAMMMKALEQGSLGSSYHSDLLDLLFAFLSTMDAVPTPHFPASPEALTAVLVQGCHRPPGTHWLVSLAN